MRPSLSVLSPDLIERILEEAFRVLDETGMEIRGHEMRRRLLEAGLPTTADGRVHFPRAVVEAAIESAPKAFTLFDRDGLPHADLGEDRVHFVPGSSGLKWLDHRTNEVRLADSTDFVEYVRLGDGLEQLMERLRQLDAGGVPLRVASRRDGGEAAADVGHRARELGQRLRRSAGDLRVGQ